MGDFASSEYKLPDANRLKQTQIYAEDTDQREEKLKGATCMFLKTVVIVRYIVA